MRRAGFRVWDPEELLPGANWAAAVAHALKRADAMVVILSQDALDSRHVLSEIQYALGEKRFRGRLVGVLAGRTAAASIPSALDRPVDARKDPSRAARQVARLLEGKSGRSLVRGEASA